MNRLRARLRRTPLARSDLAWVLAATLLTFALSSKLELQEHIARATARFEAWQLDELPMTLLVLSLGLAGYAWRRRGEAARLLAHNRELAQQLIAVQDNERVALARELHDDLGQHCTAIRIEAAYIERAHDAAQICAAARRAAASAELLHGSVRRLLHRLRPAELDELGLVAAMQALCRDWQARSGVRCSFQPQSALPSLGEAIDTAVYRVTQEALSNVMRHAQAHAVRIELSAGRGALVLRVADDGRGFDTDTQTRGLGLLGATERAAALGGALQVLGAPGAGTRLVMRLPLHAQPRSRPQPAPVPRSSPNALDAHRGATPTTPQEQAAA
jgi:signal transduction histidine kinase